MDQLDFSNVVRIPFRKPWILLGVAALSVFWSAVAAFGQEMTVQPTPFTALIDFATWSQQPEATQALPIWIESVQIIPADTAAPLDMGLPVRDAAPHTIFRIRLRSIPSLGGQVLLRLYFDDTPGKAPTVSAWSDTAGCRFTSQPLGAGLDLPASETLSITTDGVNYLDIDVPGDGKSARKALLSPLKQSAVNTALDFAPATQTPPQKTPLADPFGNADAVLPTQNDACLYGRVQATLEAGVVKLTPAGTGTAAEDSSAIAYEFNLESAPLLCLVTFEILNADPLAPLQATINDQPLGAVVARYPDLADPGYVGRVQPLQPMRFQYGGWLRAQAVIPGSALRAGTNAFTLQLSPASGPAAIRNVELQLKHNWRSLDYNITP